MSYRTVAISADCPIEIPRWFVDKHGRYMHFNFRDLKNASLPMASIHEREFDQGKDESLLVDFQTVLRDLPGDSAYAGIKMDGIEIVFFHECGGVTKVCVSAEAIRFFEPQKWEEVIKPTHRGCYGCSKP